MRYKSRSCSSPMATSSLLSVSISCSSFKPYRTRAKHPPISISTNPSHLDPVHLRDLLASASYSCHRFPLIDADGRPEPLDLRKLGIAVSHSSVVVSVFCRSKLLCPDRGDDVPAFGFDELFEKAVLASESESDRRLVGFGRAVSDGGLTASIHDVVVMPSLRRQGIGRKIVQRILGILGSRGIYDISALCSKTERCSPSSVLFFQACGFGEDSLGSTTMMYTRTTPSYQHVGLMFKPAGRMLLLVPPVREPFLSKKIALEIDGVTED